jgi:hypothetical protein
MMRALREAISPPSARTIAVRELEQAQRDLLEAQTRAEYFAAQVKFNQARIARLGGYVGMSLKGSEQ